MKREGKRKKKKEKKGGKNEKRGKMILKGWRDRRGKKKKMKMEGK